MVPAAPPTVPEGIASFCAVLSVKFNVYETCATGSMMNTMCGAFAPDRLPIIGNAASWAKAQDETAKKTPSAYFMVVSFQLRSIAAAAEFVPPIHPPQYSDPQ